jgi:hypothetical protein
MSPSVIKVKDSIISFVNPANGYCQRSKLNRQEDRKKKAVSTNVDPLSEFSFLIPCSESSMIIRDFPGLASSERMSQSAPGLVERPR